MEPIELPDELASIRHNNLYKTPPDYFSNLAGEVMGKINLPLNANTPFSAPPANYFTTLAKAILLKVKNENAPSQSEVEQELQEIEPLLTRIPKTNVYSVPQGYFDSFSVAVPAPKKPARIMKLRRPFTWFSSAAAAVITGVIAVSIVFSVRDGNTNVNAGNGYMQEQLSKIPDYEITTYLNTTSPEAEAMLQQEINDGTTDDNGAFKPLLENVSDNEIQNYLTENDDVR